MREIKFRGWDVKSKKYRGLGNVQDLFTIRSDGEVNKDYLLEQYTGLHDKNGKEIYEGDILSTHRESYFHNYITGDEDAIDQDLKGLVVIIASKGACLKKPKYYCNLSGEDGTLNQYYNFSAYRSEVIGNIHENPDLL